MVSRAKNLILVGTIINSSLNSFQFVQSEFSICFITWNRCTLYHIRMRTIKVRYDFKHRFYLLMELNRVYSTLSLFIALLFSTYLFFPQITEVFIKKNLNTMTEFLAVYIWQKMCIVSLLKHTGSPSILWG